MRRVAATRALGALAAVITFATVALAALALTVGGCAPRGADWIMVREITPSFLATINASEPAIATDRHGRIALTWVTHEPAGADLWIALSRDTGATFGAPMRVNGGPGSVSSAPESRPAAAYGPSGQLAIIWSERKGTDSPDADLLVRASGDAGATFGPAAMVNDDQGAARGIFHGFPGLAFLGDGSLFAAWIETPATGQRPLEEEPAGAVLYAVSHDGGQRWTENQTLDDQVCPCCRIAVAAAEVSGAAAGAVGASAPGRIAVAYRSARGGMRDPALAVSGDGGQSFGLDTVVAEDRWRLEACPMSGPALVWNRSGGGQFAWLTGGERPGAFLMPWREESGAAGMRRALDDGLLGANHPRLAGLGAITLIGLEGRPKGDSTRTVLAVRALEPGGGLTSWCFLGADVRDGWLAAVDPRSAIACWVEKTDDGPRLRLARLTRRR